MIITPLFPPRFDRIAYLLEPAKVLPALEPWAMRHEVAVVSLFGMDWEDDLTPWAQASPLKRVKDFGGGATAFLARLLDETIPRVEERLATPLAGRMLGGVSLGGLFALWAGTQTDAFDALLSVSGSLWYEGFAEYMERTPLHPAVQTIYLTYGEAEAKARIPLLATTAERHRQVAARCRAQGRRVGFEVSEGGHFDRGPERLLRALDFVV